MTIPQFPRHLPSPDDQPITTLYVNHWTPPVSERRQEIDECLRRNLECPAIDRIVLLASSTPEHRRAVPASPKLVWVDLPVERARYSDLFAAINACTTTPWDLNIAANSDVFFDETLNVLKVHDLFGVCVALSRWEVHDGQDETLAGDNSQDAWIFQGPVRPCADPTDFPIGTYGCDWKIAWVLRHADYALINCPYDVRHHHLHQCPYRNNGSMTPGPYVSRIPYQRLAEAHVPRGRHSRGGILAFSLWGDDPRYTVGAVENAKLAKWIYPDWTVRVYADGSVPEQTVADLRAAGAEIIPAPKWDQWLGGMFWRLQAIDDPGFVRWGIRDADSRLTYRERQAVDSWIDSGWPLHTIRDHPGHQQPVMLCGFDGQRAAIQDIGSHIAAWRVNHGDGYGSDEAMIRERLWPEIRAKTLVHSEFGNLHGHGGVIRPFPTKSPERLRFIGERIYADNHHNGEDRDCYIPARWAIQPMRVPTREDLLTLVPAGAAVAEIGVFRGEFSAVILARVRPAALHLIDLWSGATTSGDKDGRNIVTVEDMEAMYRELAARYREEPAVRFHRGDSVEVLRQFPSHSLDAAYLDSSHAYESTLRELQELARVVRPGGWLMGHDYMPSCPVWDAVNDWLASTRQRIAYLTEHDGCPSFAIAIV